MTSSLHAVRATIATDLRSIAGTFDVFTDRAAATADPEAKPYVVLFPADGRFEALLLQDADAETRPDAVIVTGNVYGSASTASQTADTVLNRWGASPCPFEAGLAARSRRLLMRDTPTAVALPSEDPESRRAGFRLSMRITTEPIS